MPIQAASQWCPALSSAPLWHFELQTRCPFALSTLCGYGPCKACQAVPILRAAGGPYNFPEGWAGSFPVPCEAPALGPSARPAPVTPQPSLTLCRHSTWAPTLAQLSWVTSPPRHAPCPHPFPLPCSGPGAPVRGLGSRASTGCSSGPSSPSPGALQPPVLCLPAWPGSLQ